MVQRDNEPLLDWGWLCMFSDNDYLLICINKFAFVRLESAARGIEKLAGWTQQGSLIV